MAELTLHLFEVFDAIVKYKHVGHAARALHLASSTVTHNMANMEEACGVTLFRHTRTGIELTEVGGKIRDKVESMLSLLDELKNICASKNAVGSEQELAIGASRGSSAGQIAELINDFISQGSPARIVHKTGTSDEIAGLLKNQGIEVGFVTRPSDDDAVITRAVANTRLIFVEAKDASFARSSKIAVSELAKLPLIVGSTTVGSSRIIDRLNETVDGTASLNIKMRCDSPGSLKLAVQSGLGVGLMYEDLVTQELSDGRFKELTVQGIDLRGHNYVAYLKDRPLTPAAEELVEFATQWRRNGHAVTKPSSLRLRNS